MTSAPDAYWAHPADELLAALNTTPSGLSSAEAQARAAGPGRRRLADEPARAALASFARQFANPLILILLFATVVAALTGSLVEASIILVIVFGSALLSFVQEYNANSAVARLKARVEIRSLVLRDGVPVHVPSESVVPGDIVQLSAGSLIPADGVLLEARDFHVNQGALTGETFPVEKQPGTSPERAGLSGRTNCVFMGTSVRSGAARALVVRAGAATEYGQIAQRLTVREPETDFERGVRRFGAMLSRLMFALVLIVFAVNVYFQRPVIDSLLFSIALAVGITPQLLPAIVSITLSKGSRQMASQGVIVRRLASIEDFGSMDVLCTDKTGTLTEGVVRLDGSYDPDGNPSETVRKLAWANASLQTGLENPLDEAIRAAVASPVESFTKIDEIPFDFVRKRVSVVVEQDGQPCMITKGALDNVLSVCDRAGDAPLTQLAREAIAERFQSWSEQGFRVLGVATRQLAAKTDFTRRDEHHMTFVGFLTFFDPPKEGVQSTIQHLAEMGIELKIITGDSQAVAQHVARAVGLEVTASVTGADMETMADEALWHTVERASLFSEVDPNQKERIILALRKRGHVVGYLGDGINDAPPLHAADVGVSVDQAVDVAKEAADFVLLEQDLSVLERGVKLGRTTFANTLKYIHVTASANLGNMLSLAGGSLFLTFLPMLPIQILLTNLLTDTPAIGISSDQVDQELVGRPMRWNLAEIRSFMFVFGAVSSAFDFLTFGLLLLVLHASAIEFRSAWFIGSVLTELLAMLALRTRRTFFRSQPGRLLLTSSVIIAGVTLLLPYLPANLLLGLTPLSAGVILALLGITALYALATEATKRFFYRGSHVRTRAPHSA